MENIAIIPARGGSKRIPKKNIKIFCGKPIIAYSIEAALKSNIYDEVMVSTDSEEIASISEQYGAKVPFLRSEETASDYATTKDVLLEVLSNYSYRGQEFTNMTCIYPTAPFVTAEKLEKAMQVYNDSNCSLLIPVVRFSYPPQRAYCIHDGRLDFKWEEYRYTRSQDLEPFYHEAGQFYIYKINDYLEAEGTIKNNISPFILPETEVQDIDTEEDWEMAEIKYSMMRNSYNE